VKYEAWLHTPHCEYKHHLINKLTNTQYNNFLELFIKNKNSATYILFKKLYTLFDIPNLDIYAESELIKLNKITKVIPLKSAVDVFGKINSAHITVHNVNKLLLYLIDMDDFKNNKINITWGPGNHGNPIDNVEQHFIKHVLSDESIYWESILGEMNSDAYAQYAIDNFYNMTNVIVHTDGLNVYLSGFHNNIFIIGRYDNNVFGISSCYYVEGGTKPGRYSGLCCELNLRLS
jgi:hypothetical protein